MLKLEMVVPKDFFEEVRTTISSKAGRIDTRNGSSL